MRICIKCSILFENKYGNICRTCKNKDQKELRKRNKNYHTKKYEKTINGYLMRTYRNMLSRVNGILKSKAHLYYGLEILSKESFYKWSIENENFNILFLKYEESNFNLKFAPSIDRINSKNGYVIENMRWITFSENSKLGALSENRNSF